MPTYFIAPPLLIRLQQTRPEDQFVNRCTDLGIRLAGDFVAGDPYQIVAGAQLPVHVVQDGPQLPPHAVAYDCAADAAADDKAVTVVCQAVWRNTERQPLVPPGLTGAAQPGEIGPAA